MIDALIEQLIAATEAGKLTWVRDNKERYIYHEHSLGLSVSTWVIYIKGVDVYKAKSQRDLHDLCMAIENSIRAHNTKTREGVIQQLMTQLAAL